MKKSQNVELFKAAVGGPEQWRAFAGQLSANQLAVLQDELERIIRDLQGYLENAVSARENLRLRLKQHSEAGELARRNKRRAVAKTSLRAFLCEPLLENDKPLADLSLCTKSGASVRLDALTFDAQSGTVEVKNVNEAKQLLQQKVECKAYWHLYYIRNDNRSAGYGWERPFLDEIFVM
jgi:hypothetical protein